jgi:hypothetical protein
VYCRDNYSMEVRSDPFESAKSHLFDTSSWSPFCDVTLTLKQARSLFPPAISPRRDVRLGPKCDLAASQR